MAAVARGLSARGHDVTVILSKYHEDWQREHPDWVPFELHPDVKVVIQPKHRGRESVFSFRAIFAKGRFDVVMSHSSSYTIPMILACVWLRHRPALIHVEHSGGIGTDSFGRRTRVRFSVGAFLKNLLMRFLDAQFAVSEGTSDAICRVKGYPRNRIHTVYNPVLDGVFMRKMNEEPTHPWLRNVASPVVVAAGTFTACKNYQNLLLAWRDVVRNIPARLIIFGKGPERDSYERMISDLGISDSVSLPGYTNNLPAELKHASCFVVSSKFESFSVVLVEALAAGVPVVSTDCPYGPAEILRKGKYGILAKNNDVGALADGILKVLKDGGIKPTPEMVVPYTMDSIVNRYENAICQVMDRRKDLAK